MECDHQIWQALWRWTVRRHPTKGKKWIKERYFKRVKGRDWRFKEKDKLLPVLAEYHIQQHYKIKADANPFDPQFDKYFEDRLTRRMEKTLEGRRKIWWLWEWQDGICPGCGQKLTPVTKWHLHHIVKRSERGSDKLTNLGLRHPNCHMQHHAVERSVAAGVSMFK